MAAIPTYTSSPINVNPPSRVFADGPSSCAMRYTPLSSTATTSAPPMPRTTNGLSHVQNKVTTSATPMKTEGAPQPEDTPSPVTTPRLQKLAIPHQPGPSPGIVPQTAHPVTTHQQPFSLYSPPHHQSPASATATAPTFPPPFHPHHRRDLSNPPGYVQNTRASFDDRPILEPEEPAPRLSFTNPTGARKSHGGGILNGEMYHDGRHGSDEDEKGIWDTAVEWAKMAGKKLGEGEEHVWKVVSGER